MTSFQSCTVIPKGLLFFVVNKTETVTTVIDHRRSLHCLTSGTAHCLQSKCYLSYPIMEVASLIKPADNLYG